MGARSNFADFELFSRLSDGRIDKDDTVHPVRVLMYIQGNVLVT